MIFQIFIFLISIIVLLWLSSRLVNTLINMAKYLRWREFIIAFFIMAFAGSLPNLLIDVNAVLRGLPEIALGDILGGNLVDLTLVIAIAVFFSRKNLPAESEMVQRSALFTGVFAVLPLALMWDNKLTRMDGLVLIFSFFVYAFWLFAKKGRFQKIYKTRKKKKRDIIPYGKMRFFFDLVKIVFFLILLLTASHIIIYSLESISVQLGVSLSLVAIFILGLGNCLPETYFSIISAKKGENWMILGDLMGSVVVCATLVLGLILVISPFEIKDASPFFTARVFTVIAALVFIILISTGRKITKKEGLIFLFIYIGFLLFEIFKPFLLG